MKIPNHHRERYYQGFANGFIIGALAIVAAVFLFVKIFIK